MKKNKYILDTNIFVLLAKNEFFGNFFEEEYQNQASAEFYYTMISLGELDSIIKKNNWGNKRVIELNNIVKGFKLIGMKSIKIIEAYGTLDAFSQGKLKSNPLPNGITARNMGKNDLWIAATAYATNATLITTDKDFTHLNQQFISIDYIDIQQFK
jgi:predicted nucleic acid-binding protein